MTALESTLEGFLEVDHSVSEPLAVTVAALAWAAQTLAEVISSGPLGGRLGEEVGANSDGDRQRALDVVADELFAKA